MELSVSQFADWSALLKPDQLQVLISVHLLKSTNNQKIVELTKLSERKVKSIIKALENLRLIRVRREPVIEPLDTNLRQQGQSWSEDAEIRQDLPDLVKSDKNESDNAGIGHELPNFAKNDQIRPQDAEIGQKLQNLADHDQVEADKNRPKIAESGHGLPELSLTDQTKKPDEPKENQVENQKEIPGNLTLQAIHAALPNLNQKNTHIKELNIDPIQEDPNNTRARISRERMCACARERVSGGGRRKSHA